MREERAKERIKDYPLGVYLVVEARGEQMSAPTDHARHLGDAVFGFDAIDKREIIARHQPLVNAAVTALIVKLNISADVTRILEGVELTLPDGRPLYSFTFSLSAPRLSFGRAAGAEDLRTFERTFPALLADDNLATPSRLLVDALRRRNDGLESFILAWAALEVLIGKQMTKCENGRWIESVRDAARAAAVELHREVLARCRPFYSFADRTKAFCLLNGPTNADAIIARITHLRTTFREPLYHEGRFDENNLPVDAVIELVRQLMGSVANRASGGN
jgi:hypothetical protein